MRFSPIKDVNVNKVLLRSYNLIYEHCFTTTSAKGDRFIPARRQLLLKTWDS